MDKFFLFLQFIYPGDIESRCTSNPKFFALVTTELHIYIMHSSRIGCI